MTSYNYEQFSSGAYDLDNFDGPRPGDKALDFPVTTPDGTARNLLDFNGRFLVLELGSITCPLFQSRRTKMSDLVTENPDVDFAILYIREAHPGKGIPQPTDMKGKADNARHLCTDQGEARPVLIDDMAGTAHKAYGSFPNSVFIINRNNCVLYRGDWNNPHATGRALAALKAGRPASGEGVFLPAKPAVLFSTLRAAGRDALFDFFRDLPHLFWKNVVKRNLRLLFGKRSGITPDHHC